MKTESIKIVEYDRPEVKMLIIAPVSIICVSPGHSEGTDDEEVDP